MRIVGAIITIVSVVSFCLPATAEGKTGDQKRENPHIVFSSFFAPGNSSQSKRVNVPVTLVFEVTKGTDTKRFCQNSPRILDAVMRDLYKKPIKIRKNRAINLPVLGARLTSVANGAIKAIKAAKYWRCEWVALTAGNATSIIGKCAMPDGVRRMADVPPVVRSMTQTPDGVLRTKVASRRLLS